MTPEEQASLQQLSQELAAAEQSDWQPRCIARAFARQPDEMILTLQGWIDLDLAKSPLLLGELPDGDNLIAQLSDGVDAFGIGPLDVTPEEAVVLAQKMREAVSNAFSTVLRMESPRGEGDHSLEHEGFGSWVKVLTYLISELGLSRHDALGTPVAQAYALISCRQFIAGWRVGGLSYAQRDVEEGR